MIPTILQKLENGNIFLEASAGTGKTYTIVELVTSLLESSYGISRLAIITFTEKAAGELQDRIRKGIENKIRNTNHSQKEYFLKQLEDLPFANIGTIHNFCRHLLSQSPEACDFFPFKTEERDVSYRIQRAFELYLENVESQATKEEKEEEFIQFFLDFDLEKLRTFCIEVIYKTGLQKLKFQALEWELVQKQFQDLIQDINNQLPNPILERYSNAQVTKELFGELQENKILTKEIKLNKTTFKDKNINMDNWNEKFKIINFEVEYLEQQEKLSALINFVNNWIDFYENYQKKENFLSTDDIIFLTEKMLQEHSDVKKTLSEKFDFIIVDECQDTDPRQFSILSMLASSSKNSSNLRLILVGDKKQSIYRFRNADISTVDYYIGKLVPQENILPLDTSYRSRKVLNCFFNEIFSKPTFSSFKYANVSTGRTDKVALEDKPSVILGCGDSTTNKNAETIRLENAELIAGFIKAIYNNEEEGYVIWDKYESQKRKIRYSDIAILANTNSELKKIQSFLLSQSIPCSTYKEKDYYEENLVSALSFMLHSIENPHDTQSFLFCLDSPLFLVPVPILSELASAGTLSYFQSVLPDVEKYKELNQIFKLFNEAHSQRYTQSASFLIQSILEKMNTLPRLASGFYGRKYLTLLYQFYDIINELQYEQNMGFGEIAREMRRRVLNKTEGEKRLDYEELDERQDTVKLMTIHASKGLEFPVCILFTAFKTISPTTQSNILKFRNSSTSGKLDFSFEFKFKLKNEKNLQTLQFQEAKKQDDEEEAKEEARRMYVACTRARDYLFLPLGFPEKKISKFSESLKELLARKSNFVQSIIQTNLAKCLETHAGISPEDTSVIYPVQENIKVNPQEQERKLEKALKNIKDISKWEFISYSKLHRQEERKEREKLILEKSSDEEILPKEEEVQGDSFWGRQFGLLCHKVLEIFPFEKLSSKKDWKKNLEIICHETYKEFGIESAHPAYSLETLISLASSALSYEYTIDQKKAPIPCWEYVQKERKFYSEGGKLGDWILGTWDLLFMFEEKYYILDWKTDQAIGESLETHCLESYKYQIYIYSFVLLQNLLQVSKTSNVKEVYEKKFGGMLFVFLRHLNSGDGVYFVKPTLEEMKNFIEKG